MLVINVSIPPMEWVKMKVVNLSAKDNKESLKNILFVVLYLLNSKKRRLCK